MIKNLAYRLRNNWNAWRIIRLLCGIVFSIQGVVVNDWVLAVSGLFIITHALWNTCMACYTLKR